LFFEQLAINAYLGLAHREMAVAASSGSLCLQSVYILSAGWGLIGASFLTSYYDITFSQSVILRSRGSAAGRQTGITISACCRSRRLRTSGGHLLRRIDILFFGDKDYLPLFCSLTSAIITRKTVFYNSAQVPRSARH
jgi:hypothetical protein